MIQGCCRLLCDTLTFSLWLQIFGWLVWSRKAGGRGVAAGGFHLNLLSTQLHACQLCVCVWVCSSLWPKAMSGLWPKCLPVCDFYAPPSPIVVNRQRQSMRQSVRQLVTYSMRDAAVLIHLICERTFMRCCLMRCARNVGNAFFLLLASIKIQIQHDACQGNKPTIYTQAPRPPQCGEGGER